WSGTKGLPVCWFVRSESNIHWRREWIAYRPSLAGEAKPSMLKNTKNNKLSSQCFREVMEEINRIDVMG
ncbi:MAG: hypothetical protein VX662_02335, partial [SAR324 cluster bacterium]|nr:hypothetical protein [SAR324 cluster bacterium]